MDELWVIHIECSISGGQEWLLAWGAPEAAEQRPNLLMTVTDRERLRLRDVGLLEPGKSSTLQEIKEAIAAA